jgi:heme exporter protein A
MIDRISVAGLGKRYGRQRALVSVDLTLEPGKVCAVLGQNGAGKSTLLGILSTLVRPTAGKVEFYAGEKALPTDATLRRHIGLLADQSLLYGSLNAEENLRFYAGLYGLLQAEARIAELLSQVGLPAEAQKRPAGGYSRGMLQRLALARALLHDPKVLLLDEPFTGLDQEGSQALAKSMAKAKADQRLVLIVTHDLAAIAGLCDHALVLSNGRVMHESKTNAGVSGFSHDELKNIYHRYAA